MRGIFEVTICVESGDATLGRAAVDWCQVIAGLSWEYQCVYSAAPSQSM